MIILHITAHMGGGVGRALADLVINDDNTHKIIILQKPEKTEFIDKCKGKNIEIIVCPTIELMKKHSEMSDIIIWHWWHHPVMCYFLVNFPKIKARMILWSHVSGCSYPYLSPSLIQCFDYMIITSKYTMDNAYWTRTELDVIRKNASLVYGQGMLGDIACKKEYGLCSDKINIGYVGTFAKSKINVDFVKACEIILKRHDNVVFTMVGDYESGRWIRAEAETKGIGGHFNFLGYVTNINDELKQMDIFGYPLNPYNFATTENSILEAMISGLPVVLLNQGTEKYIVHHNEDGLLAENMNDYVECICELIENESLRMRIGQQASDNIKKKYCYKDNLKRFNSVINTVGKMERKTHDFKGVLGEFPYEWFVSGLNENDFIIIDSKDMDRLKDIFCEKNKSSIRHFYSIYKEDVRLRELYDRLP